MQIMFWLLLAVFTIVSQCFTIPDSRTYGYIEIPQRRSPDFDFEKRFLPAKERRAPLEGFEDMSGFLRTIDGIQKPRFGK